jgi:hypothetical protein
MIRQIMINKDNFNINLYILKILNGLILIKLFKTNMKQLLFLACSILLILSLIGRSECRMIQFSGRNWYVRQNYAL